MFQQDACRTDDVRRVVIVGHLGPRGHLIGLQRRTGAKHRLVRALLGGSVRTGIDGVAQQRPGFQHPCIGLAIAGFQVAGQPFVLRETGLAPRQLGHQFIHHGVVLDALRRQSHTAQGRAKGAFLGLVESVDDVGHLAVQADVTAIIQQHAVEPLVPVEAVLAIPRRRGVSPLRTAFGIEVEHKHVALRHALQHLRARIGPPGLHHPDGLRIVPLHGIPDGPSRGFQIHTFHAASLVEGIHAVIIGLAEEAVHLFII